MRTRYSIFLTEFTRTACQSKELPTTSTKKLQTSPLRIVLSATTKASPTMPSRPRSPPPAYTAQAHQRSTTLQNHAIDSGDLERAARRVTRASRTGAIVFDATAKKRRCVVALLIAVGSLASCVALFASDFESTHWAVVWSSTLLMLAIFWLLENATIGCLNGHPLEAGLPAVVMLLCALTAVIVNNMNAEIERTAQS